MQGLSARRNLSVLAVTTCGMLGLAGVASAATFTVNDSTDAASSSPSATNCESTNGGSCTLRAAVQAADNAGGASQIIVPAGTYKLTIPSAGTSSPATGDFDILNGATVTVTGAGSASTVINPAGIDRAFAVHAGAGLSISGVTIKNGAQPNTSPSYNSIAPSQGGAFYNDGSLSINSSVLTGNSAIYGGGVVFSDAAATLTSITNSTVTANTSNSDGGALYVESGAITLTGDTITHNTADSDGGMLYDDEFGNTAGPVTVGSSTISSNVGDGDAGALYIDGAGAANISNSTFSNNSNDDSDGGAIYQDESGRLTVTGSTFNGNSAADSDGGALYVDESDLTVSGSTFTGNVGDDGGAIYQDGTSPTALSTIDTSTFADNSGTDSDGGAVDADYGNLTVTNSTFTDNSTADDGGGLAYESSDNLALVNDTFDGNQANEGGGVYFSENASTGTLSLLNDTIARNSAYEGGGVYEPGDANSIQNTIVANNSGGTGSAGGADCYGAGTDSAGAADLGGNIDSDGTCFSASVTHNQINTNPLLGQLADNGGPTETDLLQTSSPAIGSATASACPATDQRAVARSAVQGQCDSGAFQAEPASLTLTKTAPASATVGYPFNYTLTASDGGPGPSTGTTITDQLPANTTLYGVTPSQGTCTSTGTPATVTCALGIINNGSSATVTMVVAVSTAGSVTNTATGSNDQGNTPSASATTQINAAASTPNTTPNTPNTPNTPSTPNNTPIAPTATSNGTASGSITRTGANLMGQVTTNGQSTAYFFQYGRSSQYGQATPVQSTTTPGSVAATITGLQYHTQYHYRLVAINTTGVSYGADQTFVTGLRVKATKVGLANRHPHATHQPNRYTVAGKLTLPHGITKAQGCTGSLTITLTSGTKRLTSHRVKVSRSCSYKTTFTVTRKLAPHAKLHARASFGGNSALFGTKSKPVTLRHP